AGRDAAVGVERDAPHFAGHARCAGVDPVQRDDQFALQRAGCGGQGCRERGDVRRFVGLVDRDTDAQVHGGAGYAGRRRRTASSSSGGTALSANNTPMYASAPPATATTSWTASSAAPMPSPTVSATARRGRIDVPGRRSRRARNSRKPFAPARNSSSEAVVIAPPSAPAAGIRITLSSTASSSDTPLAI